MDHVAPYLLFGTVGLLILSIAVWTFIQERKRRLKFLAWYQKHGLSFNTRRQYRMDDLLPQFRALHQGRNRYAYNLFSGNLAGLNVLGFDYHYEVTRHSSDRKRTTHYHFSALLAITDYQFQPLSIRDESWFDKVTEFVGFDDIDFESGEFSREFYVKSKDKRWAYDVIQPKTIELLLKSPHYTMQMDGQGLMFYRNTRFDTYEFETAASMMREMIDNIPKDIRQCIESPGYADGLRAALDRCI